MKEFIFYWLDGKVDTRWTLPIPDDINVFDILKSTQVGFSGPDYLSNYSKLHSNNSIIQSSNFTYCSCSSPQIEMRTTSIGGGGSTYKFCKKCRLEAL